MRTFATIATVKTAEPIKPESPLQFKGKDDYTHPDLMCVRQFGFVH